MFQNPQGPCLFEAANHTEHFDTFHKKGRSKNEVEPTKKLIPTRGVQKYQFKVKYPILPPILLILWLVCIFLRSKNPSTVQKFRKNLTFRQRKNYRFMSNLGTRALLLATPTSLYFLVFFKYWVTALPHRSTL